MQFWFDFNIMVNLEILLSAVKKTLLYMFPSTYFYAHFGISHKNAHKKLMRSTKSDKFVIR